jgi:hypothetical protein
MDIGRCFKDAWNLLTRDLMPLVVTVVVAAAVTTVVGWLVGVVAGNSFSFSYTGNQFELEDVSWGLLALSWLIFAVVSLLVTAWEYSTLYKIMLRRVRQGTAAQIGDLGLGLQSFGAFAVATLVIGLLIVVGLIVFIIPGLILMTIWIYALILVADKGSGVGEAMSGSQALAKKPGYFMTFVTALVGVIVVVVIGAVLGAVFGAVLGSVSWIAQLVSTLIGSLVGMYMMAYILAMYFQATGETGLVDHALYGMPLPAAQATDGGQLPAPPAPVTAYPPAPSAPIGGEPPAPAAPIVAPPPPPPPAAVSPGVMPAAAPEAPPAVPAAPAAPDVWATAADPLASPEAPAAPAAEPPAASAPPTVDEGSGTLVQHCSQCGAAIEGSHEFCQACGFELSGGHEHAGEDAAAGGDGSVAAEGDEPAAT